MNSTTNKAKLYIACTSAAGLAMVAVGLLQWASPNLPRFSSYFLLALLASTLKLRLPGVTGTMSVSFLFILIGVAECSFSETMLMGGAAALVQSVWKAQLKPKPVQILFNVATLAISIGVSYWGSHFTLTASHTNSLSVLLALAGCLYFVSNTILVAVVVSLTEQEPLRKIWRQCHSWAFPYYLVGAAIAALVSASSRSVGWKVPLLVLPVMYLTYLYYRVYLDGVEPKQTQPTAEERESVIALSSREP